MSCNSQPGNTIEDGQRIVYTLLGDQLIETSVEVGSSSDTQTEISGGELKKGM